MNFGIQNIKFKFISIDPIKAAKYFKISFINDNYKWFTLKENIEIKKEINYPNYRYHLIINDYKKTKCEILLGKTFFTETVFGRAYFEINWKKDINKNIKIDLFSNNNIMGTVEFTPIKSIPGPSPSIKTIISGTFGYKKFNRNVPNEAVSWINKNKNYIEVINIAHWAMASHQWRDNETIVYYKKK